MKIDQSPGVKKDAEKAKPKQAMKPLMPKISLEEIDTAQRKTINIEASKKKSSDVSPLMDNKSSGRFTLRGIKTRKVTISPRKNQSSLGSRRSQ